jgi:hypothetical protein
MHIDGNAPIDAKRWSEQRFRELIQKYREAGATDRQILNAMTASPAMIDPVRRPSARRVAVLRSASATTSADQLWESARAICSSET